MPEIHILLFVLLTGAILLIFLCECIFDAKWVNYSSDDDMATVFISRLVGNRYNYRVENLDYTFEKNENGKWTYIPEFTDIKKRIAAFVIVFLASYFCNAYIYSTWVPTFGSILQGIVLGALSFLTLITNPIEAYIYLMIDLHKRDREE